MFGSEKAFRRPQESAVIAMEKRVGRNSNELINSQETRAKEALENDTSLIKVLQGERAFNTIKNLDSADQQLDAAAAIIKKTPFITKYIPDHLTEPEEQAGFLVAVVLADTKGAYTLQ